MIKIIEQRIYGIEIDAIDDNFDYIACSNDEFIEEAEVYGLIWSDLQKFINQLNSGEINTEVTHFRIINIERN
jgi:hypothetical protein